MQKELNDMFDIDNTIVLPNGIDFSKYQNINETTAEIRDSINVPNDSYVIGHIGRFTEAKNHEKLVDIFREAVNREPSAYLLMIGTGELQEAVESKLAKYGLEDKYKILQKRNDIPRLLRAMDVFVFPSVFEGLPVTLVEAQISNLRCIISTRVTDECFFSENAVPLDVTAPTSDWVDAIFDKEIKGPYHNNIMAFNMNSVISRLSSLYKF